MRPRLWSADHPPRSRAVLFVVSIGRNRCDRLKHALLPVAEHNLVMRLPRLFKIPVPAQADAATAVSRHIKGFTRQERSGGQCPHLQQKDEYEPKEQEPAGALASVPGSGGRVRGVAQDTHAGRNMLRCQGDTPVFRGTDFPAERGGVDRS